MYRFLLAIDDTDNLESKGTGWLARKLAKDISKAFRITLHGVTRHQLFLHPDIPYTTHNSSACLDFDVADNAPQEIFAFATGIVQNLSAPDSDPGVSLSVFEGINEHIQEFGQRAQCEVVTMEEAYGLAARHHILLKELGGTGQGIIGALAGIGLKATGNDGRYLELAGIRELEGIITAREIIDNSAIHRVIEHQTAKDIPAADLVNTLNWVRPTQYGHEPVLKVKRDGQNEYWIPAEKPQKE